MTVRYWASGKDENGYFIVKMIKVVEEGEILMIRRNVDVDSGRIFIARCSVKSNTTTRDCFSGC